MHKKRAHTVKQESSRVGHLPLRTIQRIFAYTSSQPSEGQTPVGCEALAQPDLWGSFAKRCLISDLVTGTK